MRPLGSSPSPRSNGALLRAIAAALLLLPSGWLLAFTPPSALLFGATLEDARAFAVDSAASRGWRILSVTMHTAIFEQVLEGDREDGTLVAERLLRIYASFTEDADGAHVALRAEEVESPETPDEWRSDVTDRYAANLEKALASLRNRWEAQHPGTATRALPDRTQDMGRVAPSSSPLTPLEVGAWAYAAERYAQSRGCQLTDRATRLESSGQGWEEHRVHCEGGPDILVQCRYGDCTSGR